MLVVALTITHEAAAQSRTSTAASAAAQSVSDSSPTSLGELLQRAVSASPIVHAARARLMAARARERPAGARPDPMLMAAVVNLPVTAPSFTNDEMTMKMVGIGQSIPYRGKLALRRRVAEFESQAAEASLAMARLDVMRMVKEAYYELAYLDRALDLLEQNGTVLGEIVAVSEARYSSGVGGQQEVLTSRVEAARVAATASTLLEQRRAVLAGLNAVLDRPSSSPVDQPAIPERIVRAAVEKDPSAIRFAAKTAGARAAGSPIPDLAVLEATSDRRSPLLREQDARFAAQSARVALAARDYKPDIDVSVQYGQRQQLRDMLTVQVSMPLQLRRADIQAQRVAEARAELVGIAAERRTERNDVSASVARRVADAERARAHLAIYTIAVLPQGRAAVAASLAAFRAGTAGLAAVLDAQATLFSHETAYARALSDFAMAVAALEQVVGEEVLP